MGIPLKQIEENVLNIIQRKYPSSTEVNRKKFICQIISIFSIACHEERFLRSAHLLFTNHSLCFVLFQDVDESEQSITAVLWKTFKRFREQRETSAKTATNDQTKKEEKCSICWENLNLHKTETFSCQHTFHRNCLEEWFKIERTCPLCRTILLFNDEYPDLK